MEEKRRGKGTVVETGKKEKKSAGVIETGKRGRKYDQKRAFKNVDLK